LTLGPFLSGNRLHIRIYEGNRPCDCSPGPLGQWSIASVHREHYVAPLWHVIHGWEEPQEILHGLFARSSHVRHVTTAMSPESGIYQGYPFDGAVSLIELV
jgi:hypothetical protein